MRIKLKKAIQLIAIIVIGIFLVTTVLVFAHKSADWVLASGPIPPPDGYPKLSLSTKVVTPALTMPDTPVLTYIVEIVNTGAYPATDVTLKDEIPNFTIYNGDAQSSAPPTPVISDSVLLWQHGEVGFDTTVFITFTVTVTPGYEGIISNTAVISDPMIADPVTVMAETYVTDHPIFEISKTGNPAVPGPTHPLTYELTVTNRGQPAENTPITVTDFLPEGTAFLKAGPDGTYYPDEKVVIWERDENIGIGETDVFTFSVTFEPDVVSGTVITNSLYHVVGPQDIGYGEPYGTKVIDPIFVLSKGIYPDPPGSNTYITYTITILNLGSMATDLEVTDVVPDNITYVSGGDSYENGVVIWHIPDLGNRESVQVSFVAEIGDIADIIILNGDYGVCSAEGVCAQGIPVPSLIVGPTFEAIATLDPIAKGTGGGTKPVTPTLTVRNIGPGNALDATALLTFGRISVSNVDVLEVIPPVGTLESGPPCDEQFQCWNYVWTGNLAVGDMITVTTIEPQSTIGGAQGTHYTATVVITDQLGSYVTEPVSDTAVGLITHFANLIPTKSAPAQIGPGQTMTYTIQVFDSAYTTEMEPPPVLTETVPASVTLLSVSDGGITYPVGDRTAISWTLPAMGPGDYLYRYFEVMANEDLISGMLIINDEYGTAWHESEITGTMSIVGEPVTTTVHEVGLIDSYKTVTPTWAVPGTGIVLTYTVHVVNTGPNNLTNVKVDDVFPWEHTTYQRDAVATSGEIISDIVSLDWTGNVDAYSEQLITFTAVVDDFFEGVVTNTATISHPSLEQDKVVTAVAYITNKPVLRISKVATPDPVMVHTPLLYQVRVSNLGQLATRLVITDTVPDYTTYITGTASSGGQLEDGMIKWNLPLVEPGGTLNLTFQVMVNGGNEIVNQSYAVRCAEGVVAYGEPVITRVKYNLKYTYMPFITKH